MNINDLVCIELLKHINKIDQHHLDDLKKFFFFFAFLIFTKMLKHTDFR